MSSPAERYADWQAQQAQQRLTGRAPASELVAAFRDRYTFPLDDFQVQACGALAAGESVLVAAPTGSGKTVVGEFAVELALQTSRKCFSTAASTARTIHWIAGP